MPVSVNKTPFAGKPQLEAGKDRMSQVQSQSRLQNKTLSQKTHTTINENSDKATTTASQGQHYPFSGSARQLRVPSFSSRLTIN